MDLSRLIRLINIESRDHGAWAIPTWILLVLCRDTDVQVFGILGDVRAGGRSSLVLQDAHADVILVSVGVVGVGRVY